MQTNMTFAGYRLYTVTPRLLGLIDDTTNWYIRFNRRRLKGENGVEDTKHALNTLFEVLYTLCRGLAPFIPFLTDTIYLKLLPHIPEKLRGEDSRSVHFLKYPEVRTELYNPEIERKIGRMKSVIDLARVSRERKAIGVKTPLRTLVIIHTDPQYIEDVRSVQSYIEEELNVHNLVLTSDEAAYNVQYSVLADWPVLGKKLRKDMGRVKKALPNVTSDQVKDYAATGKILVDGIELVEGDLRIHRKVKEDESTKESEINSDNDVMTILDCQIYPELKNEGLGREIINRVQRLRKAAGLVPTDDVKMEYKILSDPEGLGLEEVFVSQSAQLQKALRRPLEKYEGTTTAGEGQSEKEPAPIKEETQEVQGATFLLRLLTL